MIGKRVRVVSAESAHGDVIAGLAEHLARSVTTRKPPLHYLVGAIAKYGILDLTYGTTSPSEQIPRPGIGILRQMSLRDDASAGQETLGDELFLEDMVRECEGPQLYLKLFMHVDPSPSAPRASALSHRLPPDFWPATFVVDDACLTNARSIWLMKHFYL